VNAGILGLPDSVSATILSLVMAKALRIE